MAAMVSRRLEREKSKKKPRDELRRYLDADLEKGSIDPVKWWGVSHVPTPVSYSQTNIANVSIVPFLGVSDPLSDGS